MNSKAGLEEETWTLEAFTVVHKGLCPHAACIHMYPMGSPPFHSVFKEKVDLHIYVIFSISIVILSVTIQWGRELVSTVQSLSRVQLFATP